jgi:hypothetical protein
LVLVYIFTRTILPKNRLLFNLIRYLYFLSKLYVWKGTSDVLLRTSDDESTESIWFDW